MCLPVYLSVLWRRDNLLFHIQALWQTSKIYLCSGLVQGNSVKKPPDDHLQTEIKGGQYSKKGGQYLEKTFSTDFS